MRTLMKVLKNLFGNNTKISAENIAIKDNNNEAKTLDEYLSFSFASMHTNFGFKDFTSETTVTGWEDPISYGDFTADISNNRIIIKNTTLLEVSGLTCGNGYAIIKYNVDDTNGNEIEGNNAGRQTLVQFAGNGYWQVSLPNKVYELDPTKKYYLTLRANAYNGDTFCMNNGFGKYGTWLQAKKLK